MSEDAMPATETARESTQRPSDDPWTYPTPKNAPAASQEARVDWFLGSVFGGKAQVDAEMQGVLVDHAESYLRSCGSVGWTEWQLLSTVSRAAFEAAGRRIEDDRCSRVAELVALRLLGELAKRK